MNRIKQIVLTGGPCAGKTSSLDVINSYFSDKYIVLRIAESTTELMSGGVFPNCFTDKSDYMECQTRLQLLKEEIFKKTADELAVNQDKSILVVLDRGLLDIKAYMTDEEFGRMLSNLNLTEEEILKRYDAVFHLTSVAIEAPEKYSNSNNEIRKEKPAEAAELDRKVLQAWSGHRCLERITSEEGMESKMEVLISKIEQIMEGE